MIEYYVIGLFIEKYGADWVKEFLKWRLAQVSKISTSILNLSTYFKMFKKMFKSRSRQVQKPEDYWSRLACGADGSE